MQFVTSRSEALDKLKKYIENDISNYNTKRNFVEIALIKKWKEIIGQDIAKYCWPIKIVYSDIKNSNGIIFLKTKRGRSMEIEFKNDEIIEKLNQYFGYKAINKISVVQDFDVKDSYKKSKIIKKKNTNNHSKVINKIKKNELKTALKNLSKTLFDQ